MASPCSSLVTLLFVSGDPVPRDIDGALETSRVMLRFRADRTDDKLVPHTPVKGPPRTAPCPRAQLPQVAAFHLTRVRRAEAQSGHHQLSDRVGDCLALCLR